MRWSIIRLIWLRELRDQLRDRRTLFMIAVLPILLYPTLGFVLFSMAGSFSNQPSNILVEGENNLPQLTPRSRGFSPLPALAWFTCTPGTGVEQAAAAAALAQRRLDDPRQDYPPLFLPGPGSPRLPSIYLNTPTDSDVHKFRFQALRLTQEDGAPGSKTADEAATAFLKRIDRTPLEQREADLLVVVPPDFVQRLDEGGAPPLYLLGRDNDPRSAQARARMLNVLTLWEKRLRATRFVRHNEPATYDHVFEVRDPQQATPDREKVANDLFDTLAKVLPVILIMWSLAGALYPAIDVCAGEKERGTMETLLISPASREEIVWGKFLTIWVFSALTALLNLASMGVTTWWMLPNEIPQEQFRTSALFWGVVLLLPVSAFFSAVCLAVGAYARSSKEGQYYLMPLFMVTMPLIFLTMVPDVVLNPFWSMVPVTGVALLLQALIAPGKLSGAVWYYFIPVLAPMALYSWMALRWAIEQFKREEVLFREAERLDIGLWLKRLFREKERLPSAGEAVFCFLLILLLNRVTLTFGDGLPLLVQTAIRYLAFMAAPPLFMALLLTTRPKAGLALRNAPGWSWPAAAALAGLLFFPCAELIRLTFEMMPTLKPLVDEYARSLTPDVAAPGLGLPAPVQRWLSFLVLVILGAVSEEVAFRGFILTGLRQRFKPATAVLLSSFLFALSQMNVFQFVPHFLLGAVLGFLVLRTGSLWPGVVFHLLYNALATGPVLLPEEFSHFGYADESFTADYLLRAVMAGGGLLLAGAVLLAIVRWTRPPAPVGENEAVAPPPAFDAAHWKPALAKPAPAQLTKVDQRTREN